MSDVVDFRVDERCAIGHDGLNTIIFKRLSGKPVKGYRRFDGASWKAIRFIYRDKRALLRELRELGAAQAVETNPTLRSLPDQLRGAGTDGKSTVGGSGCQAETVLEAT